MYQSKIKKKFFGVWGGWGGRVRVSGWGAGLSDFVLLSIKILKILYLFFGGEGGGEKGGGGGGVAGGGPRVSDFFSHRIQI